LAAGIIHYNGCVYKKLWIAGFVTIYPQKRRSGEERLI